MIATEMQKSKKKKGVSLETKLLHLTVWYWSKKRGTNSVTPCACLLINALMSNTTCGLTHTNVRAAASPRTAALSSSHTNDSCTGQNNKTWPRPLCSLFQLICIQLQLVHTPFNTNHPIFLPDGDLQRAESTVPLLLSSGRRLEVKEFVMLSTVGMNGCCAA